MNKKKTVFSLVLLYLYLFSNIQLSVSSNNSISPIITPNTSTSLTMYSNEDIVLSWTVIDDNPNSYYITKNTLSWKNGKILKGEINVTFSDTEGNYEIKLSVLDYSGNLVVSSINIQVFSSLPTTTGTGVSTLTSTISSSSAGAATGSSFETLMTILTLFSVASVSIILKRRKQ